MRDVGLAAAREAASAARFLVRNSVDPIEHRIAERAKVKADATGAITFEAYAKRYIAGKEAGWKNDKHRQQWSNSLRDYAYPHIGHLRVCDVDTAAKRWTRNDDGRRRQYDMARQDGMGRDEARSTRARAGVNT
jgi:hypothetical protein